MLHGGESFDNGVARRHRLITLSHCKLCGGKRDAIKRKDAFAQNGARKCPRGACGAAERRDEGVQSPRAREGPPEARTS